MKVSFAYFKPNFSNHPLNWISVLVVFFAAFLSTDIFADYPEHQSGKRWCNQSQTACFSTPMLACTNNNMWPDRTISWMTDTVVYCKTISGVATNSFSLIDNPPDCTDLSCFPPEVPNTCPDSGTFAGFITSSSGLGSNASLNGCLVSANYVDVECTPEFSAEFPETASLGCQQIRGYQYTGEQSQQGDPEINPDDVTETDPLEPVGVQPATSDTTVFQDSETLPDGSQVDTKTTTTTENRGSGHVAEETTTTKTHKYTNGITYTEVTTETTVTAPDGSKTVTTEKNTTYTANPVTTVNITKPLGPVHESSTNPVSATTTTTTTETFDSDGNKTGSSTTASGSGDGLGNENEGSEYCDENPDAPSCIEWSPEGEGGNFDTEGYDAEIAEAKQNLTNMITDIRGEMETMFQFDGNSASLSCMEFVSFNGMSKQFCLSDYANPLSKIAAAILFIALLLALFIILR